MEQISYTVKRYVNDLIKTWSAFMLVYRFQKRFVKLGYSPEDVEGAMINIYWIIFDYRIRKFKNKGKFVSFDSCTRSETLIPFDQSSVLFSPP